MKVSTVSEGADGVAGRRLARVRALSRTELLLFWRNRTAVFSGLAMPVVLVGALSGVHLDRGTLSANAYLVTSLLGFVLLAAVFYNLVTTYVARREDLVLKRLRAGELTDGEVVAAIASPAVAVALVQILVFVLVGAVLLGLPAPVNAALLTLGVLGGLAVFVLLAAVCSLFTRTVETAQLTTLPVLLVCTIAAGLPASTLPGPLAAGLRLMPLSPVTELMRLGWLGTTGELPPQGLLGVLDDAAMPSVILAGWLILCMAVVRRRFRWEPRG